MKVVKFVKPLDGYRKEDCASFKDEVAAKLIAAGYGSEVALADTKIVDANAKK